MKQMRSFIVLWALHITAVMSVRLRIWEMSGADAKGLRRKTATTAKEQEYPYMVFFIYVAKDERFNKCSASLIKPDWVLTAAHCFNDYGNQPENVILVGGKADLKEYLSERLNKKWNEEVNETDLGVVASRGQEVFIHPNYTWTENKILHDIALVKLKKPFNTAHVKTIPLSFDRLKGSKNCTILGWGNTPRGKNYRLNVLRNKKVFSFGSSFYDDSIPVICLKPEKEGGICYGDSGSPLVCDGKVWGVASTMRFENETQCGDSLEDCYTEIWNELDWLLSVLNKSAATFEISLIQVFALIFVRLWINSNIFL